MKRRSGFTIFLGTVLLAGVAHATPKPGQDIQAPRASEVRAQRTENEDIQAPRGQQTPQDRNEEIQAPRG